MIDSSFFLGFFNIWIVQDAADGETKIGTKGMHEHGTTNVNSLKMEMKV